MSFSYDRYERSRQSSNRRTTLGFWVPLVFTVTVATAGAVAWIWSAREEDEDSSDDADLSYGEDRDVRYSGPQGAQGVAHDDESIVSRVQGIIRRTPSPQQVYDTVKGKAVAGGVALGAAVGGALASIREEDKDDFGDHSRWSEEATIRRNVEAQSAQSSAAVDIQTRSFAESVRKGPQQSSGGKRKTVAIVVSAESLMDNPHEDDDSYHSEHATLLSYLPDTDYSKVKLFVLIYSPSLKSRPSSGMDASLGSSYSAISTPAQTPGEELASVDPKPDDTVYTPALSARSSDNVLWNTLHTQALRLVETPSMVMPFTTPTGHVHMLKHIGPDLVYMVEALSGTNGSNVEEIRRWVGQTVVVVGSDGTGLGGLIDTDDEGPVSAKSEHSREKWWEKADMIGLGKGVEVVDAARLTEDFERRAVGRE